MVVPVPVMPVVSSVLHQPTVPLCPQSVELAGAPLICRSGGVWRLLGVSSRQVRSQPLRSAFDSLAANRQWMETSMAASREAEPRPTAASQGA